MGICYGKISFVLWGKSTVRENACNDLVHQRKLIAKRKVLQKTIFLYLFKFLFILLLAHLSNYNIFFTFFILQVVKMFIAVVIVFAICWLPYHMYFIFTYHFKEVTRMPLIQHVYLGFYWLAMSNSMINPFVYYWMNSRYFLSYKFGRFGKIYYNAKYVLTY